MQEWAIAGLRRAAGFANMTGPIFDKEVRVSARQRRNHVIRTLYVIVFTAVVLMVWVSFVTTFGRGSTASVARMNELGVMLMVTVGMFQFSALLLVAPVLTCTAVSDEINRSTLDVLMTTPITSLQIVVGKLLGRLLLMAALVGTSLPLLAIIRIFGGIEWKALVAMLALTLSTAIFNAALSLTLSIFNKRAYVTIILTYLTLAVMYLLIPLLLVLMNTHAPRVEEYFMYFNPVVSFYLTVLRAVRAGGFLPSYAWLSPWFQSGLQLAGALILVIVSSIWVRRAAICQATGQRLRLWGEADLEAPMDGLLKLQAKFGTEPQPPSQLLGTLLEVSDRPVLWRELHIPLIRSHGWRWAAIIATMGVLCWLYCLIGRDLLQSDVQMTFTFVYLLLPLLLATVLSATTITHEKESSSWEVLLATSLTERAVIWGKVLGVLRRVAPVTLLLFGHVLVFSLVQIGVYTDRGVFPTLAFPCAVLLMTGPLFFLTATGTFLSSWARHTTTAVMLNIGLGLLLWAGIPMVAVFFDEILSYHQKLIEKALFINPFAWDVLLFDKSRWYGNWRNTTIYAPVFGHVAQETFTFWLFIVSMGHALAGWFILWATQQRLKRPFLK